MLYCHLICPQLSWTEYTKKSCTSYFTVILNLVLQFEFTFLMFFFQIFDVLVTLFNNCSSFFETTDYSHRFITNPFHAKTAEKNKRNGEISSRLKSFKRIWNISSKLLYQIFLIDCFGLIAKRSYCIKCSKHIWYYNFELFKICGFLNSNFYGIWITFIWRAVYYS